MEIVIVMVAVMLLKMLKHFKPCWNPYVMPESKQTTLICSVEQKNASQRGWKTAKKKLKDIKTSLVDRFWPNLLSDSFCGQ